jgi:uncharacterized protein (TIGR01777 family)
VEWFPDGHTGAWSADLDTADGIINLTGASIGDKRWTAKRKAELRDSRVLTTRSLVASLRVATRRPPVFIQGSAVGYYGNFEPDKTCDEACPPGDDFLGHLCVLWEAEAHAVATLGIRLVFMRSGLVLEGNHGLLARMKTPFKFFVGGPVASGRQGMSWISLADWLAFVTWALETPAVEGVYNATSPSPVSNEEFSKALARALHRPSWLRTPAFLLRILFGEFAPIGLVGGHRVVPRRALEAGFTFKYPTIDEAMAAAFPNPSVRSS